MTIDVATTVTNSGDGFNYGNAIVGVNKFGNGSILSPVINNSESPEELENKLTERFDDPTYYA